MVLDAIDWRHGLETRFGAALRGFFRRRARSEDEANDLTQELFVRILSQDNDRRTEHAEAYVFTAAANLLREAGRRAAVRGTALHGAVDCDISSFVSPTREDLTPERIIAGKEALEIFLVALHSLGERTRSIFILHRVEQMSQKEIAKRLGVSVSAVEKHVAKALVHLTRATEP